MLGLRRFSLNRRLLRRIATGLGVLATCLVGSGLFAYRLQGVYPVQDWLVWRLLGLIAWTALLNGSFVVLGYTVLRRVIQRAELPAMELLLFSMTLGFAGFALGMFIVGALGGFHWSFALALPLAFLAVGARDVPHLWRALTSGFARRDARGTAGAWQRVAVFLATGFGATMLALLYLECLSPDSFNFDAIWYHVPIAQDYARAGRLVPFFGDNHRAYPHLASLLHTWALLVPGIEPLPLRWMLMLHLEFSFVVWRLVGAVATAEWILNGRRVPGLWAVFFVFPSIFIYDQNIAGSADHVLGATAAPIFLATARMIKDFDRRWASVVGVAAGCHILTKYQAIYLVLAVAGVVGLRVLQLLVRKLASRLRKKVTVAGDVEVRQLAVAPLLIIGCAALVSSPHFIKNWVYYDNPVYPFASRIFPSSFEEWTPPEAARSNGAASARKTKKDPADGDESFAERPALERKRATARRKAARSASSDEPWLDRFRFHSRAYDFKPQGDGLLERAVWLHKTVFDWSFDPGNRGLTKRRPYMGSLFTLLLPLLFFLRPARRLWFAVGFCYLAFVAWGLTSPNDRYLLSFLSVPIGAAMALLARGWGLGWLSRLGLVPLLALQLFWGADAPFVYGDDALEDSIRLIEKGYSNPSDEDRFNYRRKQRNLTSAFPEDALILGRYYKDLLGFDRAILNTHRDIQKYIPLGRLESTREFWYLAKDRGVTHLLYPEGQRRPHWAQDVVLFDALVEASGSKKNKGGVVYARLADEPPPDTGPLLVLVLGAKHYEDGLYPVKKLSVDERKGGSPRRTPGKGDEMRRNRTEELLERAGAVLMNGSRLRGEAHDRLEADFSRVESFGSLAVYIRKSP